MRFIEWVGQVVAWIATVTLCGGVFAGSLFALFTLIGDISTQASIAENHYSRTLTAPQVLDPDAFDVRKITAFLTDSRDDTTSLAASAAGLETVRSIATVNPTPITEVVPATDVSFGATDHVGNTAVNLRAGPSKTATRLATLEPGQELRVVGRSGNWVQVVTGSGDTGWVFGRYLGRAAETEVLTALDATDWEDEPFQAEGQMAYFEQGEIENAIETSAVLSEPQWEASDETSSSSSDPPEEVRDSAPGSER